MLLEVEDSGCGMDEATLARVFDPFFTTKEKGKGTGLGLSTVQGIIANHEGTIEVRSQPGVGSTFSIHFPLTTEAGIPSAEAETIPPGMEREVLIVDDEPSVSQSLARLLQRHGYRVFEASSPAIAIRIFGAAPTRFSAIITDITMPQINGITLAQRLRLQRPDLPVVFMTGFGHGHAHELKAQFPDAELIAKPFEEGEIAHALARLLNVER